MNANFSDKNRATMNTIFQSEASKCSVICLATVSNHHGHEVDLPPMRRRFSISLRGTTMKTILLMAQTLGVSGRG